MPAGIHNWACLMIGQTVARVEIRPVLQKIWKGQTTGGEMQIPSINEIYTAQGEVVGFVCAVNLCRPGSHGIT